jgi:hypothetical protein
VSANPTQPRRSKRSDERALGMTTKEESDARSGDQGAREERLKHNEGSGRGERMAWERQRAARAEHRGPATEPTNTNAGAEARCLTGGTTADSVPQRSTAGPRCLGLSNHRQDLDSRYRIEGNPPRLSPPHPGAKPLKEKGLRRVLPISCLVP